MLRVNPVSLNAISYNAVIRALEIIRDGHAPISKPYKQQPKIMSSGDVIHNDKTVNTGSIIGTFTIPPNERIGDKLGVARALKGYFVGYSYSKFL